MAFVTVAEARDAAEQSGTTSGLAESHVRKQASAALDTDFDIFLSHSYEDAQIIMGIKALIERQNLRVYVDWIEDAQLDRSQVTVRTAKLLRRRMKHCKFLIYASSKAATYSRWMPWEVGYFDGLRGRSQIGVVPIVKSIDQKFEGQEYLGLYNAYGMFNFVEYGRHVGREIEPGEGVLLRNALR